MEQYCCLERVHSEVSRRYDCIPLSQTNEVSIGRGNDVTVQILSKEDPLMLSRKHAIISYVEDTQKWMLVDNKSLNGIFINHVRISPLTPCEIKENDEIHFGMPSKASNSTDFIFKFTIKHLNPGEVEKISSRLSPHSNSGKVFKCPADKRKRDPESCTYDIPSTSRNVGACKKTKLRTEEERKRLEDEKKAAELKAEQAEERLKEVTEMLRKEKETVKAQYQEEMKLKENKLMKELQAERERLELEKKDIEEQMKEKFDVEMKEKESNLLAKLKTQHEELLNEKKKIHCKLQKEMEEKLCQKEKAIVQLQKSMQEKVDKEIQDKEHKMMGELMRQKEMLLKEKETVKNQYQEEMKLKENKLMKELQAERERLELEKKEIEEQMKEKFDVEMKEKESNLLAKLKTQHEELLTEKKKIQSKLQKEMEEKLCEKEEDILQLQKNMQEKLDKEIKDKEHEMMAELMRQKEDLLKEKASVEEELKEKYQRKMEEKDHHLLAAQEEMKKGLEMKIKEKEEMMLKQLRTQKEQLLAEKKIVEEGLQQEMARKLDEKNQHLQEKLEEEKKKLEDVITKKQEEFKTLESELLKSKLNSRLKVEIAKQKAMEKVSDVMESELQCSICAELFIQATTLNCSHSFCHTCIMEWFKKKKECPCCRTKVTTYTRSIVLDNYIDKMVESLSEELKIRRTEIVKERKSMTGTAATSGTFKQEIIISDDEEDDSFDEDAFREEYAHDDRFNSDDDYGVGTDWNGDPIVSDFDGMFYPSHACARCDQCGHSENYCPRTYKYE
ncbi:E3 ubiquitin-protein ligase RNF8-like isoform X3 [Anneissia japonica]|uniref:E3 ubiquitin-protein ligase RNF8-like isoform X3 n=1 Tax=Anneissia japonica TaxID=1529436 RepID=UPI001425B101|nr:E3 ubiquitin-protein ligase RNF8-like isoform X3 [Anneissia japonica]